MSSNKNISEFAHCAKALALLAAIPLEESPEEFSSAVSEAFKKILQKKTKAFLAELFVAYLSERPAPSGEYSSDFQQAIEKACNPLLKAVRTHLLQAPNDSAATTVVAPQLQAYEQMLREKERQRLDSIYQIELREQRDRQCQIEERDRQLATVANQAKAAQLAQRRLFWGAVALAALPLLIFGIKYFCVWWVQSNYAAMMFYTIFALGGLRVLRVIFEDDSDPDTAHTTAAWLTFGLILLLACLTWSSVSNIVNALIILGAIVLPFIHYARQALASIAAGIILSFVFYFAARICSFMLIAFLGWVLPAKEQAVYEKLRGSKAGEEKSFEIAPGVKMTFCWCPAGDFTMGSLESEEVSWPHEFGHGMAKLSYGAWERESVISSWMIHQGRTGMDARLGSRSEGLSTQRSVA